MDEERIDRETLIADLLEGQYSSPARIVVFNSAEEWSRDVSLARELADRLTVEGRETPPTLESFLDRHGGRPAQLPLLLRGQSAPRGS